VASIEARHLANRIVVALSIMRHRYAVVCPALVELPVNYSSARELMDSQLDKQQCDEPHSHSQATYESRQFCRAFGSCFST